MVREKVNQQQLSENTFDKKSHDINPDSSELYVGSTSVLILVLWIQQEQ